LHLLVDIERRERADRATVVKAREAMLSALCRAAGEWVEVEHYTRVTEDYLERLAPRSVVLSGNSTPWELYDREELEAFMGCLRAWRGPLLGICGGHQLLAMAYGGRVGVMRRARPGEPTDKPGGYYHGYFLERGMREVRVLVRDPIFEGLPDVIVVDEGHFCEVKELPLGFVVLASNDACRVQAMRHRELPIYGVQFHPHVYDEGHPHGRVVLENFFRIARRYSES